VRDNVTGLVWENKTDDGSIHDKDDVYNWDDAQDVFIVALNSQNFGGHNDWRLPTIKELSTLVDSSIPYPGPTINTDYFPNTVSSYYWSSTTYAFDPGDAWNVYFLDGRIFDDGKSYDDYVRAVRSGQCGSLDNFIDNDDGTITDNETGLMWQKETAPGTYTWQQALSYCESSTLAGYNDWRLPNRNELQSIVDYSRENPSIDPIFNSVSFPYWSSTTYAYSPSSAWGVDFFGGFVGGYTKSYVRYFVRAVRSGQCGSLDTSTTTTVASTTTTISGSTTSTISGSTTTTACIDPCCTEQIYGDYSEEVELLRYIRDNVFSKTPEGQELIKLYYQWSPTIVEMMEEDEGFKEEVKGIIDGVLIMLEEK